MTVSLPKQRALYRTEALQTRAAIPPNTLSASSDAHDAINGALSPGRPAQSGRSYTLTSALPRFERLRWLQY
jgi:hypothetical protein